MNRNRNMIIILCCLMFCIFLIVGYLVINDYVQESIFNNEILKIEKSDLNKNNCNIEVKTFGKYGVVEKRIKTYLCDYSSELVDISKMMNDNKLGNLLSIKNCKQDGKDFNESINYINKLRKKFNNKVDKLFIMSTEEKIMENIDNVDLESHYISLYKDSMINGNIYNELVKSGNSLEKIKKEFNTLLDDSMEVINFLKANKDDWKIENNKILFQNNDLVNEYNDLISKVEK